ncbi:MAG: hypothetical protein ABI686_03340 [Acidobacteriota bacterium]
MDKQNDSTNIKTNDLMDWGELLTAVCKRPKIYVASVKLENVLDFIGGYLYATSLLFPVEQNVLPSKNQSEWRQFSSWLGKKFGYPRNYSWYLARKYFSNDEEAIEAFPSLLKEFRKEKEENSKIS